MKKAFIPLVVVLALLAVALLVVLRIAKPCEGSYKFSFDPDVNFECTLPTQRTEAPSSRSTISASVVF